MRKSGCLVYIQWDKRFENTTLVIDSEDEKAITIVNILELVAY